MRINKRKNNLQAAKLLIDYYKYFLCQTEIQTKVVRGINGPEIQFYDYVRKDKLKEEEKLKAFLEFCPDIIVEKRKHKAYWRDYEVYVITEIDPNLPSISNNSLGINYNVEN